MCEAVAADSPMHRLLQLGGELVTAPGVPRRKFDLAHMRALLAALGNPELRFPSILIAGTNGKGSTAATTASILAAAGYTTGLYTSPHLERLNERIQILGPGRTRAARTIEDRALFAHFEQVEQASTRLIEEGLLPGPASFFETLTAIAMLAFASVDGAGKPVDLAVLEVGLGGRLDATNVVEPLLSVIADISMDHTEWLGDTLSAIAREKAGILRPNGLMITLPQHPEVNQVLGEVAVALGVQGVNAAEYLPGRDVVQGSAYTVHVSGEQVLVNSPLKGQHQQRNVALALATVSSLQTTCRFQIGTQAIEYGLRTTDWPGRLEERHRDGKPRLLLDVAHNPAGAWALRAALSQLDAEDRTGTPTGERTLIFGCMRDKAIEEMAAILFPVFDTVYLVVLPTVRSASLEELAAAADRTGAKYQVRTAEEALAEADADPHSLVVACGSVMLVGEIRRLLQ